MNPNRNLGSDLEKTLRSLQNTWAETQNSWQDSKSSKFEGNHLNTIIEEIRSFKEMLEQLDEIIQSSEESFLLE